MGHKVTHKPIQEQTGPNIDEKERHNDRHTEIINSKNVDLPNNQYKYPFKFAKKALTSGLDILTCF